MITILADHDLEGYVPLLWGTLSTEGWIELLALKLVTFKDVGLSSKSSDREVWRFAQTHRLILLTNNRNMKDEDSLEQTLRDENEQTSLPVLTISDRGRLTETNYRRRCVLQLVETVMYLENHLGRGRVYIP